MDLRLPRTSQRSTGFTGLLERGTDVVADQRNSRNLVASIEQPTFKAVTGLGELASGDREIHHEVVDLHADPDPQHDPEQHPRIRGDLAGAASGGVGIEFHGPTLPPIDDVVLLESQAE